MYHALMLLFVGLAPIRHVFQKWIFKLAVIGIILFSGSIYLLSTKQLTGIDVNYIGIVTPIGGLLLIISWLLLMFAFLSKKSINSEETK
jgi:uncharacterized membrane protein YgdD (TMEM256/DUF423 family)